MALFFLGSVGDVGVTGGSVLPEPQPSPAAACPDPLWFDDHALVLDKPAGLLCVPGRGPDKQDCMASRAQRRWPDALVVHRLDMATSGLLLMARSARMQRAFSQAFAAGQVDKRYQAIVAGRVPLPDSDDGWGDIDLPLAADWPRRPRQQVPPTGGRPSRTRWSILEHGPGWTRLELAPLTGRTHQLRVHLQAIGHPILGDALYAAAADQVRSPRMLLHACALSFDHPVDGSRLSLCCPAPF